MADRTEEIRKQALDLWNKTVAQMEEISKALVKTSGLEKFKLDRAKLLEERDRLLHRLGEETYKLIEAGKMKAPKPVLQLADRVSKVMDKLILRTRPKKAKKATKKAAKKATNKPAKKKVAKKAPAKKD
jgi:hypothetical protein